MAVMVRRFLGRDLAVPKDRLYWSEEGLWIREESRGNYSVGLTEPAVLMAGGARQVEPLVEEGSVVQTGETVCLVLTSKLKYLSCPLSGTVTFNTVTGGVECDPYGTAIFSVRSPDPELTHLTDATGYAVALSRAEGAHNPEGARGGISSTCKSVYGALQEQKFRD